MEYHAEPLDTYNWAREMSRKHLQDPVHAKEQGKLIVAGPMQFPKELLAAVSDFVYCAAEPWSMVASRDGESDSLTSRCLEESKRQGFQQDMCSYMRLYWGDVLLHKNPWGSLLKPDLIVFQADCDSRAKWFQGICEYVNVPWYCVEGTFHRLDSTLTPKEHAVMYLMEQYEEFIQWLIKLTGKPYREDSLIEALANSYRSRAYWGEIMQLQSHIPAPLDYRLLLPFYMAVETYPQEEESARMLGALRDEVKHRIANGIAPVPNEKKRVTHEGITPRYAFELLNYFRQRGVTVLGGAHHLGFISVVQKQRSDGSFHPEDPVDWAGVPKTKEEGLRFKAMHQFYVEKMSLDTKVRIMLTQGALRYWKADGAIFMLDRGCRFFHMGQPEVQAAVQRSGKPTMFYETDRVDSIGWVWEQIQDTADTFLESLGVPRKPVR